MMKKRYLLYAFLFLAFSCQKPKNQNVIEQDLGSGWTLTGDTLDISLRVEVPSVVQQSLYENGLIPHPYHGTVENDLLWISDHIWDYTLHFDVDKEMIENNIVELVFEGLDTYAEVSLNGEKLLFADNQFRTWKKWVGRYLKEKDNLLEVHFIPYDSTQLALYEQTSPKLPEKYAVSRKAPYQHGWDWAPKYKNIGIWKPVKLVFRNWNEAWLENAYVVTEAADADSANLLFFFYAYSDLYRALVDVELVVNQQKKYNFECELREGSQGIFLPVTIDNPSLWWPNGMGEQPLYDFEVHLLKDGKLLDSKSFKSGIRTVEMVDEPDSIGRAFYFKVNGVPMYAKGANYVPEEMIETWTDKDKTLKLLQEAKSSHFNMLRVWGGGVYPSDDFFNICDSLGILVWQDFMYAGTMYPSEDDFIRNAWKEADEQVKRLASHPSLALWCGGNEISEGYYNWGWQQSLGWSEEDDKTIKAGYDDLFESILPNVVDKYDGTRPYWPSSPSKGWGRPESLTEGDVHYWGVWWGELPFEIYREKVGRFNSEYGYQSYPDLQTLKEAAYVDKNFALLADYEGDSLYKKICENAFLNAHEKHARGIRQVNDFIEKYYRKPTNLAEYVYLSQLSQAYGMETAIESHRMAKPYNMGTLYWQLNDAWPVISWSSIDYYGRPKALQYKLKTLYAPVLLSLDNQSGKVFITSDKLQNTKGILNVSINDFYGNKLFEQNVDVELEANGNKAFAIDGLAKMLSQVEKNKVYIKLELYENEKTVAERLCYLVYPKDLDLPKSDIEIKTSKEGDKYILYVKSKNFAKDVCITSDVNGSFSDNYFDLEPGVTKHVTFKPDDKDSLPTFTTSNLRQ